MNPSSERHYQPFRYQTGYLLHIQQQQQQRRLHLYSCFNWTRQSYSQSKVNKKCFQGLSNLWKPFLICLKLTFLCNLVRKHLISWNYMLNLYFDTKGHFRCSLELLYIYSLSCLQFSLKMLQIKQCGLRWCVSL